MPKTLLGQPGLSKSLLSQALEDHAQGRLAKAVEGYTTVLSEHKADVKVLVNLGLALWSLGNEAGALANLETALRIRPRYAPGWNGLGVLHLGAGRVAEAEACFLKSTALDPLSPDPIFNLGKLYLLGRRMDEAEKAFSQVHAMVPSRLEPLIGLSRIHYFCGDLPAARAAADEACRRVPGNPAAETTRLLLHNYHRWLTVESLQKAHVEFGRSLSGRGPQALPAPRPESGPGRIRVGYVATNWHDHSNLRCALPVLEAHDPGRVEVFCYHLGEVSDGLTDRLRQGVEHWRKCAGMSLTAVAARIREDGIQILVGQEGYFQPEMVELLSSRIAPVQMTWSGYPHSWGLPTVDFRLTDAVLDPLGQARPKSPERILRLPWFRSFLPPVGAPAPGPLPALNAGHITFASFNNLAKIGDECAALWSEVLAALPTARLRIGQSEPGMARDSLVRRLAATGMDLSRVTFLPRLATEAYLEQHRQVDLHLDSVPYPGVTIAATALWMGLPNVCLGGDWAAGREGASQVVAAGFPEMVVADAAAYVALNVRLAQDLEGLAKFRSTARGRMAASPLLDPKTLARNLEAAYLAVLNESTVQAEAEGGSIGMNVAPRTD